MIIITADKGWVQCEGGPVEEVAPGDTVFFAAGERHWHGATAITGASLIAVTETLGGSSVEWLEPVTPADYPSLLRRKHPVPKATLTIAGLFAFLSIAPPALAQAQATPTTPVTRAGDVAGQPGLPETFTGTVSVRLLAKREAPGRTSVGLVTFAAGARSFWHSHPAGQTLYVTEGCGWTQQESQAPVRICAGDTAAVAPGVKHWHGATAGTAMSHLSITENVDGREVDWLGPVATADYSGPGPRP